VLTGKRDDAAMARALQRAGYQGEMMVLLAMTDSPYSGPASNVTADVLKRVGMNVDYQAMDFGTVLKRRESSKPPAQGGWNLCLLSIPGLVGLTPATHWHCWATAPAGRRSEDAGTARGVVQRARPHHPEEDCRADAASGV
jgi:peptide/nickel transport system substrate-binding protein